MTQTSGDPVPTITEAEASGAIKAIYDDIKAVLGAPVVNLIFRHLATLPGCLQWSWAVVRPLYAGQEAADMARQLMADLPLPSLPRLARPALRAVGVDAAAEQIISHILDAYNHTNPVNLLVLSALRMHLDSPVSAPAEGERNPYVADEQAPRAGPPILPPLLSLDEMDSSSAELVRMLNALGAAGEGRTMASMYRQLAHWPGYLALALTILQPLHATGVLQLATDHAQQQATVRIRHLAGQLYPGVLPPPAGDLHQRLAAALSYFTTKLIVEMLPVGRVLRDTL